MLAISYPIPCKPYFLLFNRPLTHPFLHLSIYPPTHPPIHLVLRSFVYTQVHACMRVCVHSVCLFVYSLTYSFMHGCTCLFIQLYDYYFPPRSGCFYVRFTFTVMLISFLGPTNSMESNLHVSFICSVFTAFIWLFHADIRASFILYTTTSS